MPDLNLTQMVQDDFNTIIRDIGVNVTLNRFTKSSSNVTGDEDVTTGFGNNTTIRVVFELEKRDYDYDKEGAVEQGTTSMYSKPIDSVDKDDKITFDGKVYLVTKKTKRYSVDMCSLELWTR